MLSVLSINYSSQLSILASDNYSSSVKYQVRIDKDNMKVAYVTASFIPQSDTLYMYPGANNHEKRWAKFVSNLSLMSQTGQSIAVTQNEDGVWLMPQDINAPVTLSYQVNLSHESFEWSGGIDGAAYAREDGVFYTGRSLFVINGDRRENIMVTFDSDDDWKVSNPWLVTEVNNQFIATDLDDLAFGMIFAGTHEEFIIREGNFEAIFALGNSVKQHQQEFTEIAQGIFDYYVSLFGGIPKTGNDDYIKTVVIVNSAAQTDGEVVGNNISILLDPEGDEMSHTIARFVLVHEFFHLWNGKSFGPQEENMEWFKEGFTNYYTLKALHHVGSLTDETFIALFENFFYQRYITDSEIGSVSMTEGDKKHSNWGVIYAGGMMASMAIDMLIRGDSDNERNLDNVMREVYTKFHGENYYTMADIKDLLETEYQSSLDSFYEEYIIGAKSIPIADFLTTAGIKSEPVNGKLGLSLETNPSESTRAIRASMMGKLDH